MRERRILGIGSLLLLAAASLSGQRRLAAPAPPPVVSHPVVAHVSPQPIVLPPGWGLAGHGTVGTVNHPGGVQTPRPIYGRSTPVTQAYIAVPVVYYAPIYLPAPEPVDDPPAVPAPTVPAAAAQYGNEYLPADYPPPPPPADMRPTQGADPPSTQISVVPHNDGTVEYTNAEAPAKVKDGPYTLVALKDHSILALSDYWVEKNRLSYVTNYDSAGAVALEQIDLDFTLKLNNDRGVKFELRDKS